MFRDLSVFECPALVAGRPCSREGTGARLCAFGWQPLALALPGGGISLFVTTVHAAGVGKVTA